MLPDLPAEQQQRCIHIHHARKIPRFDCFCKRLCKCRGIEHRPVMRCLQIILHLPDIGRVRIRLEFALLEVFVIVPVIDREGMQRPSVPGKFPRRHRGDQTRIQPARQEGSHRYIRNKLPPDGIRYQIPHMLRRLCKVLRVLLGMQIPVPAHLQALRLRIDRTVCRRKLLHTPEYPASGCAPGAEEQELADPVNADLMRNIGVLQNGFKLRAEHQPPVIQMVEQRLDADPVTRQKQPPAVMRPDGKGENAVECLQAGLAPSDICFQHDLGIGTGIEGHALCQQTAAQLGGIVQLAVVDDGVELPVMAALHGLHAVFRINDGKTGMDEGGMLGKIQPFLIGAAPPDGSLHFPEDPFL